MRSPTQRRESTAHSTTECAVATSLHGLPLAAWRACLTASSHTSPRGIYLTPALIINPLSDHEFVRFVRQKVSATGSPDELQALLRTQYEGAVVRKRELSGETTPVWYVFRDGSWTSADERIAEAP